MQRPDSVAQGLALSLTLLNVFISELKVNLNSLSIRFQDDTKLSRVLSDEDEIGTVIWSDLDPWESWAYSHNMCFSTARCWVRC